MEENAQKIVDTIHQALEPHLRKTLADKNRVT